MSKYSLPWARRGGDDAAGRLARQFWESRRGNVVDGIAELIRPFLAALGDCEAVMGAAAMHGVRDSLPPAYAESWAAAHVRARELLNGVNG